MKASRSDGQTLLSIAVATEMLAAIDRKRGTATRSAFVRECLAAHLGLSPALAAAPDRTGKGGRPTKEDLEKRRAEVMQEIDARAAELGKIRKKVDTPEVHDEVMAIENRKERLKILRGIDELKKPLE